MFNNYKYDNYEQDKTIKGNYYNLNKENEY